MIHVPARSRLGQGLALAQGQVCLEVDAPGPGSGLLMDRLADVLPVQVRHYMRRPGPAQYRRRQTRAAGGATS